MTTSLSEPTAAVSAAPPHRLKRLALGPADEPRWIRPALWGVLVAAGALYTWALTRNGYANSYYSAAVKSGTQSWKAFFFGSLDSQSFITVDKPPMALWVQEIAARIFGFSSWSLLLPQALLGVAAIAVLYATVRRAFGPVAGVIAALVMALTPMTVAINRDNNPDTLLVLLLVLAAWACQRSLESGKLHWLLASAFFLGCGFNTKMLQAYLLLPALGLVHLLFAQGGLLRRIRQLLAAGAVLAVSSLWWTIIVDLVPASSRPYIGGSKDGTAWDLIIGYNGIGRITGEGNVPGGGGMPGGGGRMPGGIAAGFSGQAGIGRMFNETLGGQISWLLPFSALVLVAGVVLYRRRPRTDLARAALVLWGTWLVVHFLVLSYAGGIMHAYYTTAMAPAIAALTGIGAVELFRLHGRGRTWAWVLPLGVAITGAWAVVILNRTPHWNPWLSWVVAVLTVIAVAGLLAGAYGPAALTRLTLAAAVTGLVVALAGQASYAVSTTQKVTTGADPLAGPTTRFGGMQGGRFPGGMPFPGGGEMPGGGRFPGGGFPGGQAMRGMLGGAMSVDSKLVSYLERHQDGATWLVAVGNALGASSIILQTGKPAISMFGFTDSDPAMTAGKLQELVKAGRLHYVMVNGTGGGFPAMAMGGGRNPSTEVDSWVTRNCTQVKASEYGGGSSPVGGMMGAESLYRCG